MKKLLIIIFVLILSFCHFFVFAADKVEINTASSEQLETLTGVGPVKALAIIDARPFSSVDDLLRVSGIGEKTLQKIKDQGLAYVVESPTVDQNIAVVKDTTTPETTTIEPIEAISEQIKDSIYPAGIFINEVLPNPEGPDETDEWIELYNSNNFDVDLSGWQVRDTAGTTKTHTIPQDTKILANGFLVFKRPETKIMLNNDGDGITLLAPNKKIIDFVNFTSAPLGQSYNKTTSDWQWGPIPTPGAKNIVAIKKTLSNMENSVKNNNIEPGLASLNRNINTSQIINPWFLFFTVLATTIILAIIVLFIKFTLSNNSAKRN